MLEMQKTHFLFLVVCGIVMCTTILPRVHHYINTHTLVLYKPWTSPEGASVNANENGNVHAVNDTDPLQFSAENASFISKLDAEKSFRKDVAGKNEGSIRRIKTSDSNEEMQKQPQRNGTTSTTTDVIPNMKTILYWTTHYRVNWSLIEPTGSEPFASCEYSRCMLTADTSKLDEADMLLFFNLDQPHFPNSRNRNQLYVHINRDPPRNPEEMYLDEYEDKINLTINYRKGADLSQPNGRIVRNKIITSEPYKPRVPLSQKKYSVVWMVSHCLTPSQRRLYVRELSKYIDVHIYGKCGNMSCAKENNTFCFETFEKDYKFYLSFENRFCKEYYTEKLMNPMHVELVPVVLGLADYDKDHIVPPRSVINALHYKSPRDLAQYLHRLSRNDKEYYKYFEWKQNYHIESRGSYRCFLCEALHTKKYETDGVVVPSYKRSTEGTYREWWQGPCEHDKMDKLRAAGHW